jgi:hypothetical protein
MGSVHPDLSRAMSRSGRAVSRRRRIVAAAAGVVAIAAGWAIDLAGPAYAASSSISVSPNSGLVTGGSVKVTVTVAQATPSGVLIGVTQCGNATSAGAPLSSIDSSDCVGASGFGSTLTVIGAKGGGDLTTPVPAGTYTATLKLVETGIGSASTKCIASPPATLPCQIEASTGSLTGAQYTGPGSFTVTAPITYANNGSSATTTGGGSTTTVARVTTTTQSNSGTQNITVTKGATSSSSGTTTTTATTVPTTTTAATSATTVAPAAAAAAPPTTTPGSGGLAYTGPPRILWVLGLTALGLLDLGYLTLSATWKGRRAHR